MEKKKKLTISGVARKSIKNIELAKTQSKNSVVIEKKPSRFTNKSSSNKFSSSGYKGKSFIGSRPSSFSKHINPITNDFEKRKLAEQRATRRIKGEAPSKDSKLKIGSKKRELKLTISRALSDDIETKARSLASLKRAKLKESRDLKFFYELKGL